ncbi:MAG TPA: SH3 domain-containing protein [Candidatus Binatia bacterium]|nr:SH3 domain-containing protein [Candidatus Binatia bacterium]
MRINGSFGAALAALAFFAGATEAAMTVKDRARFREGPSVAGRLLGVLDPGTTVDVLEDRDGWKRVQTPDGREGFVWGDHLVDADADASAGRREPSGAGARSLADEIRDLRAELREHPEPATAADLERVRAELERLATAERDLAHRFEERGLPGAVPLDPPAPSTTLASTALVFLGGGLVGFAWSRFLQRRRDRRPRRLRF